MADAAPRVAVGDVDELADGVLAVAGDRGRDALGDGGDLAPDDETAVVVAGDVRLDDDVARPALGQRAVERGPHGIVRAQVEVDAASVVAVERLDHAREPEPVGDGHRPLLGVDHVGARDGQPGRIEQPVGQALVGRHVDPDGRGLRGHRRPDPLLMDAVPELDQRVPVEPEERDVAADRLVDQRLGGRPERLAFGQPDEPLHLGREVEERVGIVRGGQVVDQRDRHAARFEPDRLLAVLEDAVVLAVRTRRARLAVADVRPGEVLELERHVLGDMAGPRAVAQPGDEPAAPTERAGVVLQGRQQGDERIGEVGQQVRRVLLEHAEVDQQADDRLAGPVVRAAQDARLEDPQRRRGAAGRLRGRAARPAPIAGRGSGAGHGVGHGTPPGGVAAHPVGAQLDAASAPGNACRFGVATRSRRRRSKR